MWKTDREELDIRIDWRTKAMKIVSWIPIIEIIIDFYTITYLFGWPCFIHKWKIKMDHIIKKEKNQTKRQWTSTSFGSWIFSFSRASSSTCNMSISFLNLCVSFSNSSFTYTSDVLWLLGGEEFPFSNSDSMLLLSLALQLSACSGFWNQSCIALFFTSVF